MADNTESVHDLMKAIEDETIVLPEFQRNFVWSIDKTFDLFDSLCRDIFIGAIIYGKPSFDITIREIDNRPRKGKGSRRALQTKTLTYNQVKKETGTSHFRLLLDGQQRITSIYRALKGTDKVWMIIKNEEELPEEVKEKHPDRRELEEVLYEFASYQDDSRLSILLSDVYEMLTKTYREKYIDENFFSKTLYAGKYDEDDEEKDNAFIAYLTYKDKLSNLFKDNKLFNYYMLDMSLSKFALFFERSNSRGVRLDFIDILSAKLYTGFKLRKKIEEFEDENTNHTPFLVQVFVRALSFIVSEGKDVSKDYILKNLYAQHFIEHWDNLIKSYKNTLNYLFDNKYIVSQKWLPYDNLLIPLMVFIREYNGDWSAVPQDISEFIGFWYWSSVFSTRYTGASNEAIEQDTKALLDIAKKGKTNDHAFFKKITRYQVTNYDDLLAYDQKRSAVYKGILNFIHFKNGGFEGWYNNSKVTLNSNLEDHHIFPRGYIDAYFAEESDAIGLKDTVVNRTLIPKLTNIKIGKKKPSVYLLEIKQKYNSELKDTLTKHTIPKEIVDGLYDEDFTDFIDERAEMLYEEFKKLIFNNKDWMEQHFIVKNQIAGKSIKIFRTYLKHDLEADFYPESEKIILQDKEFESPSAAAEWAKEKIKGEKQTANGWNFWQYIDPNTGDKKPIANLKK